MKSKNEGSKINIDMFALIFMFGIMIHMYYFLHKFLNTDDILSSIRRHNESPISNGRFGVIILHIIRGEYTLPWVIGVISIASLSFAAVLLIELWEIKSRLIGIMLGILIIAFPVLPYCFSYVFIADTYAIGISMAVISAYCLAKKNIFSCVLGGICLMASLSLYQAYAALTIGICMITICLKCYNNEFTFKQLINLIRHIMGGGGIRNCNILNYMQNSIID